MLDRTDVSSAYPDEFLESVIERMSLLNIAHLVVLSREDATLVGYLSWRDLLRVRTQVQREDTQRAAFYRWSRPRNRGGERQGFSIPGK